MNATDVRADAAGAGEGRRAPDHRRLRFRDEMAIIAAGTEPQVACGLTGHQRTLRAALDGIAPTDGPTRVKEAVELARRLLADAKNRKVIVLTDGGFDDAAALLGRRRRTSKPSWWASRTGNVGITRFQVRRSLLDPIGYEILAEVANLPTQPVDMPARDRPGRRTWSTSCRSSSSRAARGRKVFEKTSADGGRLTARIDRADALAADNQAWAILPRRDIAAGDARHRRQPVPREGVPGHPAGRAERSSRSSRAPRPRR